MACIIGDVAPHCQQFIIPLLGRRLQEMPLPESHQKMSVILYRHLIRNSRLGTRWHGNMQKVGRSQCLDSSESFVNNCPWWILLRACYMLDSNQTICSLFIHLSDKSFIDCLPCARHCKKKTEDSEFLILKRNFSSGHGRWHRKHRTYDATKSRRKRKKRIKRRGCNFNWFHNFVTSQVRCKEPGTTPSSN